MPERRSRLPASRRVRASLSAVAIQGIGVEWGRGAIATPTHTLADGLPMKATGLHSEAASLLPIAVLCALAALIVGVTALILVASPVTTHFQPVLSSPLAPLVVALLRVVLVVALLAVSWVVTRLAICSSLAVLCLTSRQLVPNVLNVLVDCRETPQVLVGNVVATAGVGRKDEAEATTNRYATGKSDEIAKDCQDDGSVRSRRFSWRRKGTPQGSCCD